MSPTFVPESFEYFPDRRKEVYSDGFETVISQKDRDDHKKRAYSHNAM